MVASKLSYAQLINFTFVARVGFVIPILNFIMRGVVIYVRFATHMHGRTFCIRLYYVSMYIQSSSNCEEHTCIHRVCSPFNSLLIWTVQCVRSIFSPIYLAGSSSRNHSHAFRRKKHSVQRAFGRRIEDALFNTVLFVFSAAGRRELG